jgi:RNA polymerase sigma-70 factor, ECF subfamily
VVPFTHAVSLSGALIREWSVMRAPSPQAITQLLLAWQSGDRQALDALVPVVHEQLRRLAHRSMKRERAGHLLQTTALVNEAYLNLVDARKVMWRDRAHFFAICAKLMREILVHYARGRDAQKRGGGFRQVSLDESALHAPAPDADLLDLDEALTALDSFDARKARVVELRFFGGLTLDETAEVLKVSADTVARDWDFAKTWLYREMTRSPKAGARSTGERG